MRLDDRALRARILSLNLLEAKHLGIGKSTLHYLRKKAESNRSFDVHGQILAKINRIQ
jgi:hypothetical protein